MRQFLILTLPSLLLACSSGSGTSDADGDDGTADDSGGTVEGPQPAPLTTPTGGCPDLTESGGYTIDSSGEERVFEILLPDPMPDGDIGLVFFFHGIANAGSNPAAQTASSLRIQDLADEHGVAVVLPEAPVQSLAGVTFHLWDLALETDNDLVLYDDLRACVAEQHPVDLHRVVATGFSGGALFTTVVGANRGDTLAALVEGSGGANIDVPIWTEPGAAWTGSDNAFPSLLITGGESDVWPEGFEIVDFVDATDTLQGALVDEGHYVVRCDHGRGHTLTNTAWEFMIDWSVSHRFGEVSPWASGELSVPQTDDCAAVE